MREKEFLTGYTRWILTQKALKAQKKERIFNTDFFLLALGVRVLRLVMLKMSIKNGYLLKNVYLS